jgi:hypothetical protein
MRKTLSESVAGKFLAELNGIPVLGPEMGSEHPLVQRLANELVGRGVEENEKIAEWLIVNLMMSMAEAGYSINYVGTEK